MGCKDCDIAQRITVCNEFLPSKVYNFADGPVMLSRHLPFIYHMFTDNYVKTCFVY